MSSARSDPFWLCHECNSQMRPIMVDGVPHCASCNGEFLEILDAEVNPDPRRELPHPPTRPGPDPEGNRNPRRSTSPGSGGGGGGGGADDGNPMGFMSSIFNLFGGEIDPEPQPVRAGGSGGSGGHQFNFQFGGGRGSFIIGGDGSGGGQQGFFGPQVGGGIQDIGGLDGFFPGFPPPPTGRPLAGGTGLGGPIRNGPGPHAGPDGVLQGPDLMRALMQILGGDGPDGNVFFMGPQGRMDMGDYVGTNQGFDEILERLMHATGPQGPLPASDVVIEGLPRFKLDEKKLEESPFKDCPVCKDDFTIDDEVMRIPCKHVFHVDCLQPWLRTNGSCPVCRFSLVPEEENRDRPRPPPAPTAAAAAAPASPTAESSTPSNPSNPSGSQQPQPSSPGTARNPVTDMLARLWGQGGSTGSAGSPTSEVPPASGIPGEWPRPIPTGPFGAASASSSARPAPSAPPPNAENENQSGGVERLPTDIPDDYRERHRQREREKEREQREARSTRDREPEVDDLD